MRFCKALSHLFVGFHPNSSDALLKTLTSLPWLTATSPKLVVLPRCTELPFTPFPINMGTIKMARKDYFTGYNGKSAFDNSIGVGGWIYFFNIYSCHCLAYYLMLAIFPCTEKGWESSFCMVIRTSCFHGKTHTHTLRQETCPIGHFYWCVTEQKAHPHSPPTESICFLLFVQRIKKRT